MAYTLAKHTWLTEEMLFNWCEEHHAYERYFPNGYFVRITRGMLTCPLSLRIFQNSVMKIIGRVPKPIRA